VAGVTNTSGVEFVRYCNLNVTLVLDPVWCSYQQGALKGGEGIFGRIVGAWIPDNLGVGVGPDQVLLIDDSPENCVAAAAAGLTTFQYTPYQPWLLEAYLREQEII